VFLQGITSDADLNNDSYVTASELGMYLQTQVVNYSNGGQHPQYGKINNPMLDKGDFIFVPRATRQEEVVGADAQEGRVSEELKRLQEERKKKRGASCQPETPFRFQAEKRGNTRSRL
jgi:hypothetical protein